MSPKLNLIIGVLALLSLPALSACNTESRGTDAVGEEGTTGEARSGTAEEEEEGTSGEASEGAEGTTQ